MKKKSDERIRKEVGGRRGLAREGRQDPKGDLRVSREGDLSRENAYTEEDIRILTDPDVSKSTRKKLVRKIREKESVPKDVTTPLMKAGVRSDSDPDCHYSPEEGFDDIVEPVPHRDGVMYFRLAMEDARRSGERFDPTEADGRTLYLGMGNLLTVRINTSMDLGDVQRALQRIWKGLGCDKSTGTNLNKAPEFLDAYQKARKHKPGKPLTDTELKRARKAKEIIRCNGFSASVNHGNFLYR